MTREQVGEVAVELTELAVGLGWRHEGTKIASTGSIYIELKRRRGDLVEWVVIRVATHKQVYHRWMTTYSYSPYEFDEEMMAEVLGREFGRTGDVFEAV